MAISPRVQRDAREERLVQASPSLRHSSSIALGRDDLALDDGQPAVDQQRARPRRAGLGVGGEGLLQAVASLPEVAGDPVVAQVGGHGQAGGGLAGTSKQ